MKIHPATVAQSHVDRQMPTLSVAFRYSSAQAPKIQDKIRRSYSWRISDTFT